MINHCHLLVQNSLTEQISLHPQTNKTGDVWHIFLKGDFKDMLYAYKFEGKFSPQEGHYYDSSQILLDPYAKVSCFCNFSLISCFIRCTSSKQTNIFFQFLDYVTYSCTSLTCLMGFPVPWPLTFLLIYLGSYKQRGIWCPRAR